MKLRARFGDQPNPFQIKAAQEFYLRTSESLRRLDLAVGIERRNAEELAQKKQAEKISLYVAEWLRIREAGARLE
jgi:hypothetical protein